MNEPAVRIERPIDHALVHRVEAFSDVVLGFCLAELALSLALPGKGEALTVVTHPYGLIAFVWTFGTICLLWVRNNHLFRHYFVPNTFSVGLNFAQLGAAVLMVYAVQVLVHAIALDGHDVRAALGMYCASFCLLQFLLGVLFLYGAIVRWPFLGKPERARAVIAIMRLFVSTLTVGAFGLIATIGGPDLLRDTALLIVFCAIAFGRVGPYGLIYLMGLSRPVGASE